MKKKVLASLLCASMVAEQCLLDAEAATEEMEQRKPTRRTAVRNHYSNGTCRGFRRCTGAWLKTEC